MLSMYDLIHGDCLDVYKTLDENSFDAVICDPPYGTTKCKWDDVIPLDAMWEMIYYVLKPGGMIVLFGGEPYGSRVRVSNIKNYKYDWTWNKVTARGHLVAKYRPMQQTEPIMVFGGTRYFPIMVPRPPDKIERRRTTEYKRTEIMGGKKTRAPRYKVYTHYYPKTIITVSHAQAHKGIHPTQKPVELMEYLIKTYTLPGERVLDFAAGSNSTVIACLNTDRHCTAIERDGDVFSAGEARVKHYIETGEDRA